MSLLTVENLQIDFKQRDSQNQSQILTAVSQINFSIEKEETVALVGESGSGKSITALSIMRLLPYPVASHPQGAIYFQKQDLLKISESAMRHIRGQSIGMIFQEPMTALNPLQTIGKQIGECFFIHKSLSGRKLTKVQVRNQALELLDAVGIREPKQRINAYPHQLSGGQRQRVMIAMAIANQPKLLIADEPTTALDVTIQAQILDLIDDLKKTLGLSVLLISHDLSLVKAFADRTVVMYQGQVVEQNDSKTLFADPQHPYTQHLIAAEPSGSAVPIIGSPSMLLTTKNLSVTFNRPQSLFKKIENKIKRKPITDAISDSVFIAVDHAKFSITKGETLGIVGESGSGKTTLAHALLKMLPATGQAIYHDLQTSSQTDLMAISNKQMRPIRKKLQIVFQDPFASLSPRMTVLQIIAEGLMVHQPKLSAQEMEQQVCQALTAVELSTDCLHRYPHEFSGGQRQRIAIARALILKPDLLILDEPTSALDRSVQSQVLALLKSLQQNNNLTYIFISHDLKMIQCISHHVLVMQNGQIIEQGPTQSLFKHPETAYTQKLLAAAF